MPLEGNARSRIIAAAAALVESGGSAAATTRAIAAAASVQAPTIYRLFGDKEGVLDAVAEQTVADYVAGKFRRELSDDPVDDLHRAWNEHIAFGLAYPAVYALMNGMRPGPPSPAAAAGLDVLRQRIGRIARAGRLRIREEHAVDLVHAIGAGTVLGLLQKPSAEGAWLFQTAWDAIAAIILGPGPPPSSFGVVGAATALRASLDAVTGLTPGEKHLMDELLLKVTQTG